MLIIAVTNSTQRVSQPGQRTSADTPFLEFLLAESRNERLRRNSRFHPNRWTEGPCITRQFLPQNGFEFGRRQRPAERRCRSIFSSPASPLLLSSTRCCNCSVRPPIFEITAAIETMLPSIGSRNVSTVSGDTLMPMCCRYSRKPAFRLSICCFLSVIRSPSSAIWFVRDCLRPQISRRPYDDPAVNRRVVGSSPT